MEVDRSNGWLVSAKADIGFLFFPTWIALLIGFWLPEGAALPPWAWVVVVLGIDVTHVYSTLWRTYAQPNEIRRRPMWYVGVPAAVWLGLLLLGRFAHDWFWTVLAYTAVFHFMRQQWGFSALYRLRQGLSGRDRSARLEKAFVYAVTGWPVLWWHAALPRSFSWFTDTDFLRGLPWAVVWVTLVPALVVCVLHVKERIRSRLWSPGRDLWALTTLGVWGGGICFAGGDAAFSLPNVVHHGIPYMALVFWTGQRMAGAAAGNPGLASGIARWVFRVRWLPLVLGVPLLLAYIEEWAWDRSLWFEQDWLFGDVVLVEHPGRWGRAFLLATLTTPQAVHYVLDGLIWRMDGRNPGLREAWEAKRVPQA